MITFVCPICRARWKVSLSRREEERPVHCPVCVVKPLNPHTDPTTS